MPKKKSHIEVTDQFCGAGGSSLGAKRALQKHGGEIRLALNHWKLAIETHNTNFPETLHDCTDVSAADPRRYPSTDILITSPECTNHSLAKGKKQVKKQIDLFEKGILDPAAERSRATMWDVPRFAEYHDYNIVIVENVVDARKWVMWEAWLKAMHLLGYNHKCCYFNSMFFHPTPQSRDRMYVVFWKKGNKAPDLEYRPVAFCHQCGCNVESVQSWKKDRRYGKFSTQYIYTCPTHACEVKPYYYASFNAIDWSDIGQRISDRKKPLSVNTMKRIQYGLDKYCQQPFQVVTYSPGYCKSILDPTGTVTANDHHGICTPFLINDQHSTGVGFRVKGMDEPISTVAGTNSMKLISPFIVKGEHNMENVRQINESMATQTARQTMGICLPVVIKHEHGNTEKVGKQPTALVKSSGDPFSTQNTRQSLALCIPQVIELNRTGKSRPTSEPLSTVLANGNHHGILTPLVVDNKGKSNSRASTDPLSTVTTKPHHGIVTTEAWNSFLGYYYGNGAQVSAIHEPMDTCRTNDGQFIVNYDKPQIEDCYYRMIKPHEVKAAMAFPADYVILGSGKDQVKQCGNAVTPPPMEFLVTRCIESLM